MLRFFRTVADMQAQTPNEQLQKGNGNMLNHFVKAQISDDLDFNLETAVAHDKAEKAL